MYKSKKTVQIKHNLMGKVKHRAHLKVSDRSDYTSDYTVH